MDRNELAVVLGRLTGAVSEKGISYVGIRTDKNKVLLTSSDRVLVVYCSLKKATIEEEGCVFVPAKIFSEIVREIPNDTVTLEKNQSSLTIRSSVSSFVITIPLLEDLYWREQPELGTMENFPLSASKLSYMIEQVAFCIQIDSPRNYGTVAYIHLAEEKKLRIVGTDGYRLSFCEGLFDFERKIFGEGITISKKGLSEIHKMCNEGFDIVNLSISADNTTLKAWVLGYEIFILLSNIRFPNYQGVLPKQQKTRVKIPKIELASVLKRVLLASDKTRALTMTFHNDRLQLMAKTVGSSESSESLKIENMERSKIQLVLNGRYLTEVINNIHSEDLLIQIDSEDSPICIEASQEPNECFSKHVIVPIKEGH